MGLRRVVLAVLVAGAVAAMAPALVLTAARVVEPGGGRWVRIVSFTPFGVVLYALSAVLLLVAGAAAGRGLRRRAAGALCAVAVAGLALHLFWVSGAYVGAPSASASDRGAFTVMTANLRLGEADPARVVEVAVRNGVSVLVLEEVTPQALTGMEAAGLGRAFPFRAGRAAAGPAGTMVLADHELTGVTPLGTGFGGYRMRLRLPAGTLTLLAVHPRPPTGDAAGWEADHRAVLVAAVASAGPVVIAGDLNATLDHAPVRALEAHGFRDAAEHARSGWQPTWPAAGQVSVLGVPVPSLLQIDHVMVDDRLRALHTDSVTIRGSDHRAVVARLALR